MFFLSDKEVVHQNVRQANVLRIFRSGVMRMCNGAASDACRAPGPPWQMPLVTFVHLCLSGHIRLTRILRRTLTKYFSLNLGILMIRPRIRTTTMIID